MSSQTSSSYLRIIPANLSQAWLVALVGTIILLVSMELFWRSQGHRPSVVDDENLWSYWREQASKTKSDTIVLLGDSRMNCGFAPKAFGEKYPRYRIVDLAVDGKGPIAVLKDLADDPAFKGIVVCQVSETTFLPQFFSDLSDRVNYYHHDWRIGKKLNRQLQTILQNKLVLFNPNIGLQRQLYALWQRQLPSPLYVVTHPDRSESVDYSRTDVKERREMWINAMRREGERLGALPVEEWLNAIQEIQKTVNKLQSKGASIAFVRFPTSGEYRVLEEKYLPREKFWNVFAASVNALTLHFEDVPSLARFTCPDDLHLDYRDADNFTRALSETMERKGIINPHLAERPRN